MSDINPYASPLHTDDLSPQGDDLGQATAAEKRRYERGLFRKGKQLVMRRGAELPARCVKTNRPAERRLKRKLFWNHPAIVFAILLGPLLYVILAFALRKKATIYVGLSEERFRKRRRAIRISWLTVLSGVAIMAISAFFLFNFNSVSNMMWMGWGVILGLVMSFGGLIYGSVCAQIVTAARISKDFIWIMGVHPDFLADLPDWPYHP